MTNKLVKTLKNKIKQSEKELEEVETGMMQRQTQLLRNDPIYAELNARQVELTRKIQDFRDLIDGREVSESVKGTPKPTTRRTN